ncbi:PREDICTED: uncharacterized protein LOC104598281 isoform X2 [Nelumbo nucifera]|uniref:Uncharacterized protein LOC104598281 isoform X2 n=1 Tax=Nelumbo nucifera TaxID=4432 RepID=A0A1U8AAB7_NELNU|nr:PREDICTED: uncharacterized protein LOC104598281 isoform X2 [Nelumbo nucifera]
MSRRRTRCTVLIDAEEAETQQQQEAQPQATQQSQPQTQPSQQQSQIQPQATYNETQVEASQRKRTRGPTLCKDLFKIDPTKRLKVGFNEMWQPIGDSGGSFSQFIGTLARNGLKLPIDASDWRKVPQTAKEDCWNSAKQIFVIPEESKDWFMKNLGIKWKTWKYQVKKKYETNANNQRPVGDPRINNEQLSNLVARWNSGKWKYLSSKNKSNREKLQLVHCAGTKSFARIHHDEEKFMTRAELFVKTHTRNDGKAVNEASENVITRIQQIMASQTVQSLSQATPIAAKDDVLSQVLGEERGGRVRGLGLGPTPISLWGATTKHQNIELVAENGELKEQINSLTNKYNELDDKLNKVLVMLHNREDSTNVPFINSPHSMHSSRASHMAGSLDLQDDEVPNNSPLVNDTVIPAMPTTNNQDGVHTTPVVGGIVNPTAEEINNLCEPVKLLDLDNEVVAYALLKNRDPTKKVQGRQLGDKWSEVLVRLSMNDNAPLMRTDAQRITIKDAVATQTIAWRNDYIEPDLFLAKRNFINSRRDAISRQAIDANSTQERRRTQRNKKTRGQAKQQTAMSPNL